MKAHHAQRAILNFPERISSISSPLRERIENTVSRMDAASKRNDFEDRVFWKNGLLDVLDAAWHHEEHKIEFAQIFPEYQNGIPILNS